MAKRSTTNKVRFDRVLSVSIPEGMAQALDELASDGISTPADFARHALRDWLISIGRYKPTPPAPRSPNGSETQVAA